MAHPRQVTFRPEQEAELQWIRDHHPKPYLRERAAAIIKVAAGQAQREVATHGLYKRRARTTISEWISRYEQEGLDGLLIKPGRGRKPAFSPCGAR
jgi:transposase